jgi:dipeptidyl aminopeptidase/acylaminoacyl peptidase
MRQVMNPKWSPDGKLIAFTEWTFDEKKVYIVPADGGDPMLLLSGDFNPSDPTWSPDGKSIAYSGVSVQDGAGTEIRILDLGSRESRSIADSKHIFSARWSPDGRYLVAQLDDLNKLFLYTFATGQWTELRNPEGAGAGWSCWSHDSGYVYSVVVNARVYRWPVAGGKAEMVLDVTNVTGPGFPAGMRFALTPDDKVVVIRDRSSTELYALDLEYR